uniref:Uncharacterized protein n=1 Tax=Glossina brevipalpis TaxID=37001 RepID=A0A1A9WL66_9MUSC
MTDNKRLGVYERQQQRQQNNVTNISISTLLNACLLGLAWLSLKLFKILRQPTTVIARVAVYDDDDVDYNDDDADDDDSVESSSTAMYLRIKCGDPHGALGGFLNLSKCPVASVSNPDYLWISQNGRLLVIAIQCRLFAEEHVNNCCDKVRQHFYKRLL